MVKNKKLVVPGLVLALALGGYSLVNAAAKTTTSATTKQIAAAATQTTAKSTQTTATTKQNATATTQTVVKGTTQPTPKINQDEASKIALRAHKDGKVTDIKVVIENGKPFYMITLQTPKGDRVLKVGGNSGKIFSDKLTAAVKK